MIWLLVLVFVGGSRQWPFETQAECEALRSSLVQVGEFDAEGRQTVILDCYYVWRQLPHHIKGER